MHHAVYSSHVPKQTGFEPLHVPLAWHVWLSSPSKWWFGLQVYVTLAWYLVPVGRSRKPPYGFPGSPQSTTEKYNHRYQPNSLRLHFLVENSTNNIHVVLWSRFSSRRRCPCWIWQLITFLFNVEANASIKLSDFFFNFIWKLFCVYEISLFVQKRRRFLGNSIFIECFSKFWISSILNDYPNDARYPNVER